MKIKAVCERTGLTDRTIRYYIEEGLLSPTYEENYLGRKSYDFSEENISELTNIAILRSFDFSIHEIKSILLDPSISLEIIKSIKSRININIESEQKKLAVLASLNEFNVYTVAELAKELSTREPLAISSEKVSANFKKQLASILKSFLFFSAIFLPLISVALTLSIKFAHAVNPVFEKTYACLAVTFLFPSIFFAFTRKTRLLSNKILKSILISLCLLTIPLCVFFSFRTVHDCDHIFNEVYGKKEASCAEEVRVIRQCERCRYTDTVILPKESHKEIPLASIPASCISEGISEGRQCEICGAVTVAQTTVPKTDHNYRLSTVSATCLNDGHTVQECDFCGHTEILSKHSATEDHQFKKNGELGYKCNKCQLEVCEYGYADGSYYHPVKYYITGIISSTNEVERTLVICGEGDMPDCPNYMFYHPWIGSPYLNEVKSIIISNGITSIANGAFDETNDEDPWFGNPFHGVTSFIVKGKDLLIDPESPALSGIKCSITYID